MIRPRGRLLLCLVLLVGISWGFLGLLRGEPLSRTLPPRPASESTTAPKSTDAKPSRIPQNPRDESPRRIQPGVVHVYEFELEAGEYVHFVVDQRGADVKADLFDRGGKFLFDVDSLNKWEGPEDVPLLARKVASFRVEVSTRQKGGSYRPRIERRRPATDEDRAWFEGAKAYGRCRSLPTPETTDQEIEACYLEAVRLWETAGHDLGKADALTKVGKLYRDQPDHRRRALTFYLEALRLCQTVGSGVREAGVQGSIGIIYMELSENQSAEVFFRSALLAAEDSDDHFEEASALTNLCKLDSMSSKFERAFTHCKQALPLWEQQGKKEKEAEVLNLLGRLYSEVGQPERGLDYHRKALALIKSDEQRAETWTHIGDVYLFLNKPQLAALHYEKSLRVQRERGDQKNEAITLNNLSVAYFKAKEFSVAQAALEQSAKLFERQKNLQGEVAAIVNLGWVLDQLRRPHKAMQTYGRALRIARETNYSNAEASALFGMAWTERNRGNLRAAQVRVEEAIAIVESQLGNIGQKDLRTTFFAGRQNFHDFLVEVLMERHRLQPGAGHDVSAFEVSERARVRSLRETLSGRLSPPRLTINEIQKKILDPETVLLEYFLGDSQNYLFVVTPTTFASYTLPRGAALEGLARDVHRLVRKSHKREYRAEIIKKSMELSRSLLGQVAGRLAGKRLLVVAPPALQYVAFSALPNPAAPSTPGVAWPEMMIERYEIVTAPSASVIASLRQNKRQRADRSGLLAFLGDAVSGLKDERLHGTNPQISLAESELDALERLKYSDDEAEEITKWFPPGSSFKVLGFDVTRDLVLSGRLGGYEILHFATHGYLNSKEAGLSGIVLSRYGRKGERIDGLLRARDIEALDLSAELVVLSACGTALGKEIRGEGLVGLTQAFFSAGPPRVIVSLWDVDDQSTSELMAIFYKHLRNDRMAPAEALRNAQLSMMKKRGRNAPIFWGGFVLQGDWQASF